MKSMRYAQLLKLLDLGYGLGPFSGSQVIKHHGPVLHGLGKSPLLILRHALTVHVNSWKV